MEAKEIIKLVKNYNKHQFVTKIAGIFIFTSPASKGRNMKENYEPNKGIVLGVETELKAIVDKIKNTDQSNPEISEDFQLP